MSYRMASREAGPPPKTGKYNLSLLPEEFTHLHLILVIGTKYKYCIYHIQKQTKCENVCEEHHGDVQDHSPQDAVQEPGDQNDELCKEVKSVTKVRSQFDS